MHLLGPFPCVVQAILKEALVYKGVKRCVSPFCSCGSITLSTGSADLLGSISNSAFIILLSLVTFSKSLGRNSQSAPRGLLPENYWNFRKKKERKRNKNRKGKLKKMELLSGLRIKTRKLRFTKGLKTPERGRSQKKKESRKLLSFVQLCYIYHFDF